MRSINIKFPLKDDTVTNSFLKMNMSTKDALSSNLLFLLLTEKGERYYHPDFGTNLLKYIFEPNDSLTSADVEAEIKRTVSLYIPNLTVSRVEFNYFDNDQEVEVGGGNRLNVRIRFTYQEDAFSEEGVLDLDF